MASPTLRRSFFTFHLTLALVLLVLSLRTAAQALDPIAGHANPHIALIGLIEAGGAILFLFARSLRVGGVLLLVTIGLVLILHALDGQFRGDLLIYAAGTWFVMIHGPAWPAMPAHPAIGESVRA